MNKPTILQDFKQAWSVLAILICLLVVNVTANSGRVVKRNSQFHFDGGGYYAYLPAHFIYKDYSYAFFNAHGLDAKEFTQEIGGKTLNKYAIGVAILQTPFFLLGHYAASNSSNYKPDGFSLPYKQWIIIGTLFYIGLALFFLRAVLLRYFPDYVTALTLIILVCGTNLLYYATYEGTMSHVYSFFLFSVLIYLTTKWQQSKKAYYLVGIGFCVGLIGCVRLTNLVVVLLALFWGISAIKDIKNSFSLFWHHRYWVLAGVAAVLIGLFPQLLNCKWQTGVWTINLYNNESFYWTEPLAGRVLFSFRKGWFVYSPLMFMGLIGFVWLRQYCKDAFFAILIFFLVNLYVVSSWWCWWYGGGFGMRALVETGAFWSMPVAACIYRISQTEVIKYFFTALLPIFLLLNLLQTYQYARGVIHYESMNRQSYFDVLGYLPPVSEKVMEKRDKHLNQAETWRARTDKMARRAIK